MSKKVLKETEKQNIVLMVRYKEEFKPLDLEEYQQKHKQAKIAYQERILKRLKGEAA
jgi:hypothetical protein